MHTTLRRLSLLLSLLPAAAVWAQPQQGSCCVQSTSYLDTMLHPTTGSDEAFFSQQPAPGTVMLLIANTDSMQDFPTRMPDRTADGASAEGCPAVDPFRTLYTTALTPPVDADTGATGFAQSNAFFSTNDFYVTYGTRLPVRHRAGLAGAMQGQDNFGLYDDYREVDRESLPANICNRLSALRQARTGSGLSAAQNTTCQNCLTASGWYRGPLINERGNPWGESRQTRLWAVRGSYLNQMPPKFVTARRVVKNVIDNTNGVRLGVATMGPGRNLFDPAIVFGTDPLLLDPANGNTAGAPSVGPSCAQSQPLNLPALLSVKSTLKAQINNAITFPRSTGWEYQDWPSTTGIYFHNRERSIGEALFSIGGFFSNQRYADGAAGTWGNWFTTTTTTGNGSIESGGNNTPSMWTKRGQAFALNSANDSFCTSCGSAGVVVLTDGRPEADNSVPAIRALQLVGYTPTSGTNSGINYCNNYSVCGPSISDACGTYNRSDLPGTNPCSKLSCDLVSGQQGPDCGNKNFMDDIAYFLARQDLRPDLSGPQTLKVHTIGFGDNSPMLQSIAEAGGGLFARADNPATLQAALQAAVNNVTQPSTSFSSAAVNSVQGSNGSLAAIVPRFSARPEKPWVGRLFRFGQYNEFVEDNDRNGDGDKEDLFIVDKNATPSLGDLVIEDGGTFVKAAAPGTAAVPYWEANDRLRTLGHAARTVRTVVDSTNDGAFTSADTQIAFTVANAATLRPYLGIVGTNFCPTFAGANGTMLTKFGLSPAAAATLLGLGAPANQADLDTLCVHALIQHVRGLDLGDEDGDNVRNETREAVLGDIFHSSPVVVDPPVDKFLCDLGLHNQCLRTLYATDLGVTHTPQAMVTGQTDCGGNPVSDRTAYDAYHHRERKRDKVLLVGANDGMLHAFHEGDASEACAAGTSTIDYNPNNGTGNELWAFIPPDLLPKLQMLAVNDHAYFVDGDIMVRDIWEDANANGTKDDGEFHTVAVVADGRGGTHYTALALNWDASGNVTPPQLRWIFPQPCSEDAADFGKTLMTLGPKAPPIGPVLLESSTLSPPVSGTNRYACSSGTSPCATSERWAVMLAGGWEPGLNRGRGIYLVDAWNGAVNGRNDNLLWKFTYDRSASGKQAEAKKRLTHSVAAPVGLVDFGGNTPNDQRQDGFFDTGVFGDTAGQIWVARLFKPGRINNTSKLVDNWSAARTFEMDRDAIVIDDDDGAGASGSQVSVRHAWPFHYLPSVAIQNDVKKLRVFLGTGNRYALLEPGAGTCRFDNPVACAKYGCKVNTKLETDKVGPRVTDNHMHWDGQNFKHARNQLTPSGKTACGTAGSSEVLSGYTKSEVQDCPINAGGDLDFGELHNNSYACGLDATGALFTCRRTDTNPQNLDDLNFTPVLATVNALGKNRFFGIHAYGAGREFLEDKNSAGNSAGDFDDARLSDRTSGNPTAGDLVDVTSVGCTPGGCDGGATAGQFGWFYEYSDLPHRTSSGAVVVGGAVLWNVMVPDAGASTGCAAPPVATGRLFQADFLTGAPNAAIGFSDGGVFIRYLSDTAVAPPPEPRQVLMVSKTGSVRYSVGGTPKPGDKGQPLTVPVSSGSDVLQSVYELPISRALHDCRHVPSDGGPGNCVEPIP